MMVRKLILIAALVAFATPALGVVKVYNADEPNGTGGDRLSFTTTLCPPIQVTPGIIGGRHVLDDTGGGTVSLSDFLLTELVFTDIGSDQLTSVFGPGSFVFVNATPTIQITGLPHTSPGSTAPAGSVAWGVIAGFRNTGTGFCIASPQTICTSGAMLPHGLTTPLGAINSTTYDLGTWSFDAVGDLEADAPYINRTNNGGTSNGQRLVRGAYVGAGVPALPLVGAGALALGLAIAGTRSLMRKK